MKARRAAASAQQVGRGGERATDLAADPRGRARLRERAGSDVPARLLYSARTRTDLIYHAELADDGTLITLTLERPQGWDGATGRIDRELLAVAGWSPAQRPLVYICGPTGFVEGVAEALVALGHEPSRIRTERFGPS